MKTPIRGARLIVSLLLFLCLTLPGFGSVLPLLRLAALKAPAKALLADNSGSITAANANGTSGAMTAGSYVPCSLNIGANLVTIDVRGTYVGQLAVYTTVNGTDRVQIASSQIVALGGTATGIAGNATGAWTVPASGKTVYVVATSWTSGTATVTMSTGAGGSLALFKASPQTFSGLVTFGGGAAFQSPAYFLGQTVTLDGGTKTIDPSLGVNVALTGSTVGTTIKLPAPSASIDGLVIRLLYGGGTAYTLDANGSTIYDAGTTQSTQAVSTSRTMVYYHGLGWFPEGLTRAAASVYYGQLAAANSWTGVNTFGGGAVLGVKLVTTNTVLTSSDPNLIDVNGSGLTVTFESAPASGRVYWIRSSSGNSVTVNGGGKNVDGSSALTLQTNVAVGFYYNGTAWYSLSIDPGYSLSISGVWTFTNGLTSSGTTTLSSKLVRSGQTLSGTGSISATGGSYVAFTGTSGGTLTLPTTSLTTGMEFVIQDEGGSAAASNIVVSGGGNNVNGSATKSITTNYGRLTLRWSGSAWFGGFVFAPFYSRRRRKAADATGPAFWV